ncbi:MAG: hypothetical protein AB7O04_13295 [Hyphomonadaceae bacterium]
MIRIAIGVFALSALGAPMIGASLADQAGRADAAVRAEQAAPSVAISKDQAIDIAEHQGVADVEEVSLSGGAWRVEGSTETGRIIEVGVSAETGGVHTLEYDPTSSQS